MKFIFFPKVMVEASNLGGVYDTIVMTVTNVDFDAGKTPTVSNQTNNRNGDSKLWRIVTDKGAT